MSERISVRPYQSDDYNKVLELFIDGINSFHWIRSYSSVFGPSCVPFWTQVVAAGVLLWITPNYTTFLLAELLGQALLLAWNYNFYASYTRHALSTNMRDKNLESWTNHPQDVSGYLVAVTEGIVVGTISYKKVDADVLEIFRLSVDKNFRKLGIAKKLVNAVGQFQCERKRRKGDFHLPLVLLPEGIIFLSQSIMCHLPEDNVPLTRR